MIYTYFISFGFRRNGVKHFANCIMDTDELIQSEKRLRDIEEKLETENSSKKVIINNFSIIKEVDGIMEEKE